MLNTTKVSLQELVNFIKLENLKFWQTYPTTITAVEAKCLLRKWISENVECEIIQLAQDAGHTARFTPSHYSDLQPIGLVLARMKSAIAQQYSNTTKLQDVKNRLDREFHLLPTDEGKEAVSKIIDHVDCIINKFIQEIRDEEESDC